VVENKGVCLLPDHPALDAYKMLRTQIFQRNNGKEARTWMVTSALPGEGKTLTAINLALTLAREYKRTVLLVDCDFRKQAVHRILGLSSEKSLVDYLVDDTPLCELIVWPGIEKLTIISGARLASEGAELMSSPRMKALVQEMKERYEDRTIIFDVPPILMRADATAFLPLVESVLLVVQAGSTAVEEIQRAVELISKEKLLGFVFNRTPSR
jgi:non-specific protein-tyrosine kinase